MFYRKYTLGFTLLLFCFQSFGWDINVNSQYNYVSGSYDQFTPQIKKATTTFENTITSSTDYGQTSINQYGDVQGLTYSIPMRDLVSLVKYGANLDSPLSAYAFSDVSDYSSVFFEEAAISYYVYGYDSVLQRSWSYFSQIRLDIRTSPRSGTGADDYFLTEQGHLDFYQYALDNNLEANYFEYFQEYDSLSSTYLDGFSWDGKATLTSILSNSVQVSEPSNFSLLCFFAFLLIVIRSKSKQTYIGIEPFAVVGVF